MNVSEEYKKIFGAIWEVLFHHESQHRHDWHVLLISISRVCAFNISGCQNFVYFQICLDRRNHLNFTIYLHAF